MSERALLAPGLATNDHAPVQGPSVSTHSVSARTVPYSRSSIRSLFPTPSEVALLPGSSLVIDGPGKVIIEKLRLDGALKIIAADPDTTIVIKDLTVENKGHEMVPLLPGEEVRQACCRAPRGCKLTQAQILHCAAPASTELQSAEIDAIRGYRMVKRETKVIEHEMPGYLTV